jgi:hypothetical protein
VRSQIEFGNEGGGELGNEGESYQFGNEGDALCCCVVASFFRGELGILSPVDGLLLWCCVIHFHWGDDQSRNGG